MRFVDAAAEAGIAGFHQVNGSAVKRHITESTGAGVALLDYDLDGDLDLFLINGGASPESAAYTPPSNALFRNDGRGRFEDVTRLAGLSSEGDWGQGVAVADVDGDGWPDLLVTNEGPRDVLHLNNGDGTFRDATRESGLSDGDWSTGAAFLDYDRDGDLDLYLANYVDWVKYSGENPDDPLVRWKGIEVFNGPRGLPPAADRFFRNNGDGTFSDVTEGAGLLLKGRGYGFVPLVWDYDDDGWADVFVANDSDGNFLWHNRGDGTFEDVALEAGVRYGQSGIAQSSMGVTSSDYDGDGDLDLFVTVFSEDMSPLYRNEGHGRFTIVTSEAGLATKSMFDGLGWGTAWFDADSDGRLDLLVVNGHVFGQSEQGGQEYRQRNRFFAGQAGGRFQDVTDQAGPGFATPWLGRGASVGDVDGDGDLDVVVNNLDDRPSLLRNDSPPGGHWLRLRLEGKGANRSAIGARVTLRAAYPAGGAGGGPGGDRLQVQEVRSADSSLSCHAHDLQFGVGPATGATADVRWPDGSRESLTGLVTERVTVVRQGEGVVGSRPLR